jgi:hypothetical protein
VLSIVLVRRYGIMGDAVGTAIPLLGTFLLFMPWHLCSKLGVRISTYVKDAYLLPLLLCVPLASVLVLMQRWRAPHSYRQLIPQLLVGGVVYGLGLGWAYITDRALHTGDLSGPAGALQLEQISPEVQNLPEEG